MSEKEIRLRQGAELLKQFKLHDWTIDLADLSNTKFRNHLTGLESSGAVGICRFASKQILIDPSLVARRNLFRQTVLHEIAHALFGRMGHGSEWLQIARRVGCTPRSLKQYRTIENKF